MFDAPPEARVDHMQRFDLVRIYMRRAAPPIQPAAIEPRTMRGVLASVSIQAQFDILNEDGMIIAINTAQNAPSNIDPMLRFELTTCSRLAYGLLAWFAPIRWSTARIQSASPTYGKSTKPILN